MPTDHYDYTAAIALPQLSDEAAVQILDFIHHVLDLFEDRYSHQIDRYYEDRSQYNMMRPNVPSTTTTIDEDDPTI